MRALALLAALLLLVPLGARGETLAGAIDQTVDGLDLSALEAALQEDSPFAATGGLRETLRALARGEITLSFDELAALVTTRFFGAVKTSLWRLTRLMAPALIWSILKHLSGKGAEAGKCACKFTDTGQGKNHV